MKNSSHAYIIKFIICMLFIVICCASLALWLLSIEKRNEASASTTPRQSRVIVLDAGHGGEDAGAIAPDGTLEKDLNLKIASLVRVLCELNGKSVVMTREDDRLLYDYFGDLDNYKGHKKEYDLKNRVKIASQYENYTFVSIHMNKFSQVKYSGLQIYYSKNCSESELLARRIQNMTKSYLQPTNNRPIQQADSSIYVLNKLEGPSVLIECGFLSNEAELASLKSEEYQARLSLVIFSAIMS